MTSEPTSSGRGQVMIVVIEVKNGSLQGQRARIRSEQTLRIGRTDRADLVIPTDDLMSGCHFELECTPEGCVLRDLGSRNGTAVNGERVAEAWLGDGDQVAAGRSQFLVRIHETPDLVGVDAASKSQLLRRPPSMVPANKMTIGSTLRSMEYEVATCDSGLKKYFGGDAPERGIELAGQLLRVAPALLLVNVQKLAEPPATFEKDRFLLNWLPEPALPIASPYTVHSSGPKEFEATVKGGWTKGAIVMILSKEPPEALLARLRTLVEFDPVTEMITPGGPALGFWMPIVMSQLLAQARPKSLEVLLEKIEAVFVAAPDGKQWNLFAQAGIESQIAKAGLVPKPPPPPAPENLK